MKLLKEKIIVGVSGGPDSMFLAFVLEKIFGKKNLLIAHFNHKFRKESDTEEKFLKKYFLKKGINFVSTRYNGTDFRESSLRQARYNFFKDLGWGKNYLALGHNLTDRIETSFLNLARGGGLKGFLNMKKYDKNKKILRPLLSISKRDIQHKCNVYQIPYFIDKTNFIDSISKRNFFRNQILTRLENKFPSIIYNFDKLYTQIEKLLPDFDFNNYLKKISENEFLLTKFPEKHLEFFIRELLDYFGVYDFRKGVIQEIISYIKYAKGGGFKQYGNLKISKSKGNIYLKFDNK